MSPNKPVFDDEAAGKSDVVNNESKPEASKSTECGWTDVGTTAGVVRSILRRSPINDSCGAGMTAA